MKMVHRNLALASLAAPANATRPHRQRVRPRLFPWGAVLGLILGLSLAARAGVTLSSNTTGDEAGPGQLVYITYTLNNNTDPAQSLSHMSPSIDLKSSKFIYEKDSAVITNDTTVLTSQNPTTVGNVLTWNLDDLYDPDPTVAIGKILTIVFAVRVDCGAATIQFSTATPLTLSTDGVRTWSALYGLTVQEPSLQLTLTPSSQTVQLSSGAIVTWTAKIKNIGLGRALNLKVKFGFDSGLIFQTGSATVGSKVDSNAGTSTSGTSPSPYSVATTIYTWDFGTDMTSDPDGGVGLSDADGDSRYDDLAPLAEVTITGIKAQTQNCDPVGLFLDVTCGNPATPCINTATDGSTAVGTITVVPAAPSFTYAFSSLTGLDYCTGVKDATFTVTNPPAASAAARNLQFTISSFPTGLAFVYPDSQSGSGTGLYTILYDWNGTIATNPTVLSGASAVTFASSKFANFPILDKGKRLVVKFDVDCLTGGSAYCSSYPLSTSIYVQPSYTDICGDGYTPVATAVAISRNEPVRLALSLGNTGTDEIYIGDTGRFYDISATIAALAGDPWLQLSGMMPVTLTYTYDPALVYTGTSNKSGLCTTDPVDNPVAHTLTWSAPPGITFSSGSPAFGCRLTFNVTDRGLGDPCEAGREYNNSFTFPTLNLTDYLGCPYTIGGSGGFRGYINQEVDYTGTPIYSMDKQVTYIDTFLTAVGETHRPYRTTVTVDFESAAPSTWSGIAKTLQPETPAGVPYLEVVLVERPSYGQVFRTLESVTYNGVDYGPNAPILANRIISNANVISYPTGVDYGGGHLGNGEAWLFLGALDAAGIPKPSAGNILEVIWDFDPPTSFGTTAQFSEIRWPVSDSGCGSEFGYESGCWMTVSDQDLTVQVTSPYSVQHGAVTTHSFLLARTNLAHYVYDVKVTMNLDPDSNVRDFAYKVGTTVFSGFTNQGGAGISAFEPTVVGNTLEWDFRAKGYRVLEAVGSISVDLLTSPCEVGTSYSLAVDYNRYAGYEADPGGTGARAATVTDTANPVLYSPTLTTTVTPLARTAVNHDDYWMLRVANTGYAPAWNLGLTATVGSAIVVDGAKLMSGADWTYTNGLRSRRPA
jgi:hypothetical protein